MTTIKDNMTGFRGNVTWGYEKDSFFKPKANNHNTITYTGADIMAKLLGGDTRYRPEYIGFIFGSNPTPLFVNDNLRNVNWGTLGTEIGVGGSYNIMMTPISTVPKYTNETTGNVDGVYSHNLVSLYGTTGHGDAHCVYKGSNYKSTLDDGDYIYNVLLINKIVTPEYDTYNIFSRASLYDGNTYPKKVTGWAIGVQWDIVFY